MSQSSTSKARRAIPEYVKRAVIARDGNKCRNCGVVTEFLHWDHLYPHDLGGATTIENIQRLCPTCNTSKGNKIQCRKCNHWMSPDKSRCSQCETPLFHSKYSRTLRGRLEHFFQRVGLVAVIGLASLALLVFLTVVFGLLYFVQRSGSSDQATDVSTIVNDSFSAPFSKPATFKITVPAGAKNSRVVGGFRVTSGTTVNFYVVTEGQLDQWSKGTARPAITQRERMASAKIRQQLQPGTYYLLFASPDADSTVTVAAEFYSKFDSSH
jgi:HNH endonuclease